MIAEKVFLPSQGLPYSGKLSAPYVMVTPITTRVYKDLIASSGEEGILNMIDSCLHECPLVAEDFVYQDELAIFLKIRSISLGSQVNITALCPHCQVRAPFVWDLLNADCEYLSVEKLPIKITLPVSKEDVEVSLPTSKTKRFAREEAVKRATKYSKKVTSFLPSLLICSLIRLPSCQDIIEKMDWYEALPLEDVVYLDDVLVKMQDFGVVTHQKLQCSLCKEDSSVTLQVDDNFFRPQPRDSYQLKTSPGTLEKGLTESNIDEQLH